MGYSKNNPKRDIFSDKGLFQEIRKISMKQPIFITKGIRKRINKGQC